MNAVQTPQGLTRAQRIHLSVRGQSRMEATIRNKNNTKTKKAVSWSLVVPLCQDCTQPVKVAQGCQRYAALHPRVPHRISWNKEKKNAAYISFCQRSYDDHILDSEVVRVLEEIEKEGQYHYFGKPIQLLPNRTVETVQEVRAAWKNLEAERDAKEAGD